MAAVVLGLWLDARPPVSESPPKPTQTGASVMCRQFIEDRLRAPATAKFSGSRVVQTGQSFRVTGVVDAQNGFGALVRSEYDCRVRSSDGETWTLVGLDLDER